MHIIKRLSFSWTACILSLLWLMWFSQTDIAAELHGRINPVVTPLTITSIEPSQINSTPATRIQGFATIERESCDYLAVEWWLDGDRRSITVPAFFADPPQVRSAGRTRWDALMVGVTPEMLADTRGNVRHECGQFPVITPFYTPDESTTARIAGAMALCESGAYTTSTGPGTCSGHGGVKEWLSE